MAVLPPLEMARYGYARLFRIPAERMVRGVSIDPGDVRFEPLTGRDNAELHLSDGEGRPCRTIAPAWSCGA